MLQTKQLNVENRDLNSQVDNRQINRIYINKKRLFVIL
jgi:hypothetical protein